MLNLLNNKYVQWGLAAVAGAAGWEGGKAVGRLIGARVEKSKTTAKNRSRSSKRGTRSRARSHEAPAVH